MLDRDPGQGIKDIETFNLWSIGYRSDLYRNPPDRKVSKSARLFDFKVPAEEDLQPLILLERCPWDSLPNTLKAALSLLYSEPSSSDLVGVRMDDYTIKFQLKEPQPIIEVPGWRTSGARIYEEMGGYHTLGGMELTFRVDEDENDRVRVGNIDFQKAPISFWREFRAAGDDEAKKEEILSQLPPYNHSFTAHPVLLQDIARFLVQSRQLAVLEYLPREL